MSIVSVRDAPLVRREAGRPRREVLLVANAQASGARDALSPAAVGRALAAAGAVVETAVTGSVEEMARCLAQAGGRRVVLLGGDGTVHAAANLPGPPPELALVPAGRANNIACALGIPREPGAAVRVAVASAARRIDLVEARCAGRRALVVEGVSVGFLAMARSRYHAANSADVPAALWAAVAALAAFHPLDVRIEGPIAGHVLHVAQLFAVSMPLFGFGLRVAPAADPGDGLLDIVAIEARGRRSVPLLVRRLSRGTHVGRPGVHLWRADRVRIAPREGTPVFGDSEALGCAPVDLRVLPGALRIVVPAP